jgi:hypothetical protein
MNARHAGRATPPAFGSFRSGTRSIWLASLALPIAVIIPVIWVFLRPQPPAPVRDIETVIKTYYGFEPLTPPSRLREPGSIYLVEGSSLRKVCEATPEMLAGKVQESKKVSQKHQSEEDSQFSLSGSFVKALNGKLSGARVATVEYGMKDAVIREIAEATLSEIELLLMSDKRCDDKVTALLNANKKVCSGYSSLAASIFYRVRFERSSDVTGKAELAAVIKEAIEETSGGSVSVHNAEEFVGENLIYGVLLSSSCLVLDTAPGRTSGAGTPSSPAPSPKT